MYYVEFITKKPHVTWEAFNAVVAEGYRTWAELHPEDRPLLAIGRTWRLGPPEASYMIVWEIDSFARLDEWGRLRTTDEASRRAIDEGTLSVATIDAGIYADIGTEML